MKWLLKSIEYEGLPLHLRRPDLMDIYSNQEKYRFLFCIEHLFQHVNQKGLPETEYNKGLLELDGDLINLFKKLKKGMIVLIETYGGSRNYWYYTNSPRIAEKGSVRIIRMQSFSNCNHE